MRFGQRSKVVNTQEQYGRHIDISVKHGRRRWRKYQVFRSSNTVIRQALLKHGGWFLSVTQKVSVRQLAVVFKI